MLNRMYNNVGEKIQVMAILMAFVGWLGCVVWAISYVANSDSSAFLAIIIAAVIAAVCALAVYVSSVILYGFGELVEAAEKKQEQA